MLLTFLFLLCSDGDTVVIRVDFEGKNLDGKENRPADPTVASPDAAARS